MRLPVAIYFTGYALALNGLCMIISGLIGLIYRDSSVGILLGSGLGTLVLGLVPIRLLPRQTDVSTKESIFIIVFGWLACSLTGAVPFYLYGGPFTLLHSVFESVSGYTTTGATILVEPELLPNGLLFWRALTHWIGGVGIMAFAMTIMPMMGRASKSLLTQEYSGLGAPPGHSRAKDVARGLFYVYIGLTLAETIFLMIAGQNWFDAITNSFATLATGGFCVKNLSIAHYNNLAVEVIVMAFMLLGALNFVFLLGLFTKPKQTKYGWEVARFYLITVLITVLIATIVIKGPIYQTWGEAFRYGSFQVINVATQTGFGTADSSVWPVAAQVVITIVTILGGCAGSTAGAIKSDRILLYFKLLRFRLKTLLHPNIVPAIRVDGRLVSLENVEKAVFYISVYLAVLCISTLALGWTGMTGVDSFTGAVACMANAGPGMGSIGTMENFNHLPALGKSILIIVMLLGRLEVFALILPFTPGFWKS